MPSIWWIFSSIRLLNNIKTDNIPTCSHCTKTNFYYQYYLLLFWLTHTCKGIIGKSLMFTQKVRVSPWKLTTPSPYGAFVVNWTLRTAMAVYVAPLLIPERIQFNQIFSIQPLPSGHSHIIWSPRQVVNLHSQVHPPDEN